MNKFNEQKKYLLENALDENETTERDIHFSDTMVYFTVCNENLPYDYASPENIYLFSREMFHGNNCPKELYDRMKSEELFINNLDFYLHRNTLIVGENGCRVSAHKEFNSTRIDSVAFSYDSGPCHRYDNRSLKCFTLIDGLWVEDAEQTRRWNGTSRTIEHDLISYYIRNDLLKFRNDCVEYGINGLFLAAPNYVPVSDIQLRTNWDINPTYGKNGELVFDLRKGTLVTFRNYLYLKTEGFYESLMEDYCSDNIFLLTPKFNIVGDNFIIKITLDRISQTAPKKISIDHLGEYKNTYQFIPGKAMWESISTNVTFTD